MRWIRKPFFQSDADHGALIVHGHTRTDHIDVRHNRIGVDLKAYQSKRLGCLIVENDTLQGLFATDQITYGPYDLDDPECKEPT